MKRKGDSEDDVLCAWKIKATEDIAYSGWKCEKWFGEIFEGALVLQKNEMAAGVLAKLVGYRVE